MKSSPLASFGFGTTRGGVHSSRTIMLSELRSLFLKTDTHTSLPEYLDLILEKNILEKATQTTRRATARYLVELYSLDREHVIFRALRTFWNADEAAAPMMAAMVAMARDPLFAASSKTILKIPVNDSFNRDDMKEAIRQASQDRFKAETVERIVRNIGSSWTQTGQLTGRTFKKRQRASASYGSAAMALLLGYLQGIRGTNLLHSRWVDILEIPPETMKKLSLQAAERGLLNFISSHEILTLSFPNLLTAAEHSILNESY